jgi:putative ABC transport system ATP-binding protein
VARALVTEPDLILADEPTGNLDSTSASDVMALLGEVHTSGRTVVLITHDRQVAAAAERTVHLLDGQVSSTGAAGPPANRPDEEPWG